MSDDGSRTSTTLIEWLHDPSNNQAWAEFAVRYSSVIKAWCLGRGLPECDADDISQKLVSEIHARIKSFHYDPARGQFRGWLYKVTQNACKTFLARDESRKFREIVDDVAARTDFEQELEAESKRELLRIARARVEGQASERDWRIFDELTSKGRRATEVAAAYQLKTATIYEIRHRILKRLKAEVKRLGGEPNFEKGCHE
jgi:RNA polymerase sigma factor (sigma-70 family)